VLTSLPAFLRNETRWSRFNEMVCYSQVDPTNRPTSARKGTSYPFQYTKVGLRTECQSTR